MKNIFESAETMAAYAEIDFSYTMLKKIYEDKPSITPLESMIDKATGYDKKLISNMKETALFLLQSIIDNKKIIEADYSGDQKAYDDIKNTI